MPRIVSDRFAISPLMSRPRKYLIHRDRPKTIVNTRYGNRSIGTVKPIEQYLLITA
jgi:hypothetical protein